MKRSRRRNSLIWAVWANGALLCAILLVVLLHGGASVPSFLSAAHAEQGAIGGGAGVFIVPGQLSINTWGCYLLDIDHQTIAAYRYTPGDKMLRLEAARNFRYDLQLEAFNTAPLPSEVGKLIEEQRAQRNGHANNGQPVAPATPAPVDGTATTAPHD